MFIYTYLYIVQKRPSPPIPRPCHGHKVDTSPAFQQYHAEEIGYTTPLIFNWVRNSAVTDYVPHCRSERHKINRLKSVAAVCNFSSPLCMDCCDLQSTITGSFLPSLRSFCSMHSRNILI